MMMMTTMISPVIVTTTQDDSSLEVHAITSKGRGGIPAMKMNRGIWSRRRILLQEVVVGEIGW